MTNYFKENFDSYVCEHDTIECMYKGIDYIARIEFDSDVTPADFDCYSTRKLNEWKRDQWFFGVLIIAAMKDGIMLDEYAACLGGIECNFNQRGNRYLKAAANEMMFEAIESANAEIKNMIEKLSA